MRRHLPEDDLRLLGQGVSRRIPRPALRGEPRGGLAARHQRDRRRTGAEIRLRQADDRAAGRGRAARHPALEPEPFRRPLQDQPQAGREDRLPRRGPRQGAEAIRRPVVRGGMDRDPLEGRGQGDRHARAADPGFLQQTGAREDGAPSPSCSATSSVTGTISGRSSWGLPSAASSSCFSRS